MGTPGPTPSVTLEDTLGVFATLDQPGTPLTATEIADHLGCARRTAHRKLEQLAERGDVETKKVGARSRVWWRSCARPGAAGGEQREAAPDQFADFVRAVEDYAIFTLDPDGYIASWNEGAKRIKGYDEGEIVGEHVSTFYTDRDVERGRPTQNLAAAADQRHIEDEGWRVREDGSRFWANVVITAIYDDGALQGFTKVTRDLTERREYEQRVESQRELERYETIIETVTDGVYTVDPEGRFTMVNEAYARMTGHSREDLIGTHVSTVADQETIETASELERELVSGERETARFEADILTADGGSIRAEATFTLLPGEGDGYERIGVVRDVTKRVEREQALAKSEQRYRTLVENFPNGGVTMFDTDLCFIAVGGENIRTQGQTAEELVGGQLEAVLPDRLAEQLVPRYRAAIEEGERQTFEVEFEGRHYLFRALPIRDGEGEVYAGMGVSQDVTERKAYERALEESEQRYRTLAEHFPNGTVTLFDDDLRYLLAEGQGFEHLPFAAKDMAGHTLREVFPGAVADRLEPAYRAALDGQEDTVELEFDGRQWAVYTTPVRDQEGEVFAGMTMVQDITEHKRREDQLREERDRFSTLFEVIPEAVVHVRFEDDAEPIVQNVNSAFETAFGYESETIFGQSLNDYVVPPASEAEAEQFDRHALELRPIQGEVQRRTADGERDFLFRGMPFEREDGTIEAIGVYVDITQRVERERALEQSERRYRTLIEHFPNGAVGLVDEDLRYTLVGGDFDGFDRSPREFEGKSPREMWPADEGKVLESKYRAALDGETSTFEVEHDGRNFRLWTVPVTDENGEVFAAMGMSQDISEEVARKRQLEQYETIVETIDDGIYALGDDLRFTMVNEGYAEMVGYPVEELLGSPITVVVDDDTVAMAEQLRERLVAGEIDGGTAEVAVLTATGETLRTETAFAPLWLDDGSLAGTVGVVRDITDRREREREFERLLDLLARTERIADVGGWEVDTATEEVFWTEHIFELLEVPYDEEPPLNEALEVYHEDDRPMIEEAIQTALNAGEPFDVEARFLTPEGEVRWLRVQGIPETIDGDVVSLRGAAQDVTERKVRERELAEQRERYRSLVEAAPVGIAIYDAEGAIAYVNDEAVELVGADAPESLVGERAIEFVHPDDREAAVDRMRRVMADRTAVPPKETKIVGLDGEVKHVIITSVPVTYEGEPAAQAVLTDISKRKEREQALQRYKTVFDTVEDGIYILGPDFHFQEVNEAYAEMTGYDRNELVGSHCSLVVGEEASGDAEEMVREMATEPGGSATLEADILTKDGNRIPGESKFTALPSGNGFRGSVGVVRDLTDRRTYERELRRYETLIEESADVNAILDANGIVQYVTPSVEYVLGYAQHEMVGENAFEYIHPDDREETNALFSGLVEGSGEPTRAEFRFRDADGTWVWLEARGRNLQDDPTIDGIVVYTQDVTDRETYERQLESRAHQQAVIADLGRQALENPDLDDLFDEAVERVAETLDTEFCKVLDLDCDSGELWLRRGIGWREGVVGQASVEANDNSQAGFTLRSEAPVVVDDLERETRFSGPELLTSHGVRSGISTVIGSVDDPWGVLGTHDTRRRSFTDEDVSFVQSVANILAEAIDRQAYENELQRVVDELAASNERLEQFAYVASHDLQEPLRMVSSYLQLLERRYTDALDDDAREYIEYAVDGADRMREMINDLLAYARVETQGEPLEPTDGEAVVDRVLTNLEVQIAETNAVVDVGELPTVAADGKQLEQVFQNLVSNAIKYRDDDLPHIEIDAIRNGPVWEFRVADNGIGMDPEQADRIFDVFTRLHTSQEYSGTGIGLALCKRIVERHGGDIWVDTAPGEGSTFHFTIPERDARRPRGDQSRSSSDREAER